ncbi:hypothetical protein BC936DRAFT_138481 [Jimgerdemannia flammicorona]|uniref:Uncharacterized protein n=1 Tax=Jimgerdemannia flammicorona TaxID=994334 RepID=A0A433CCH4_9FUNG|nr:hypothetical protein BC936DRAFT_138481 [Jimgerdemannia flammicorona]
MVSFIIRKIYQLENGKILCFLHNNRNHSTEVYYDKVPRIGSTVSNGISLKKFSRSFQFTAFEDVNGLLALYSTENGTVSLRHHPLIAIVLKYHFTCLLFYYPKHGFEFTLQLHVYSFDEKRRELSVRRANIQILPWYNNVAPKLSQILFINGTEDLCFVETSGHVRVYSLVTEQFQPADGKFPRNSEVRCSPDGTCLIAFAGKPNDSEDEMEDTFAGNFESDPLYASSEYSDDEDETLATNVEPSAIDHQFLNPRAGSIATKHLLNESTNSFADRNSSAKSSRWEGADAGDVDAHVYFLTNLNVARKIVRLHAVGDIRAIKLSLLAGLQTHLIYITSSYEYFASNILKITIERNEWRFNESNKTTINLGKVRASATFIQGNQAIDGNGTQFFNIEPDDLLVVRGEKRPVKEVLSATRLIVEGAFEGIADGFLDFKIERRPNSNAYVDCYSNMYQRYPVDSCIKDDSEMSVPLANDLQIVLGISKEHVKGNEYPDRFSKHAKDAFDELIKMTNKPASALRHFTTSVQSIEELDIIKLCKLSAARPIGHWLIQMSCLLPIQIAVAMEGYFVPLKDGVITDMDSNLGGAVNLTSISEAITFGWYESVYNFYGDREVKVVSSMGEQSTGCTHITYLRDIIHTTKEIVYFESSMRINIRRQCPDFEIDIPDISDVLKVMMMRALISATIANISWHFNADSALLN